MKNQFLTFHLPIHYLPKIALRLEYLFNNMEQACKQTHPMIHHYAIKSLIKAIKIAEKPELRGRFLKEFIRIEHKITKKECISAEEERFIQHIQALNHATGRFGESVHQDFFLQSVRVAQATEHDDTEFNCPELLFWLREDPKKRQADLNRWISHFTLLLDTISLYLCILRQVSCSQILQIHQGFHQYAINDQKACQLISIHVGREKNILPKMQLGHHGLSLRLFDASSMQAIHHGNTAIELAISNL